MKPAVAPPPIAIIGLGCLFPQAADAQRFWANIVAGVDAITDVPPTHWQPADYFDPNPKMPDHTYARRGGFLSPVDFPALDFGITPNTLEATDSTQLLGLMAARQALEDAGYGAQGKAFDRSRVSVLLGVTGTLELVIPLGARLGHPHWRRALQDAGVPQEQADDVMERIAASYVGWQEDSFPGLLGNVVAGRIANRLDLGGTNCVVDAACASSLSAVHLALMELASGRSDMVLTGGMDTFNDIFMYMCFSKTPALSPTGNARPFDQRGDGTILGEGLGCLVLKRLADAERDGDRIYAVIRSIGTSSDGKGHAIYAPSPAGQQRCLKDAYRMAEVTPESIELVEAHGTGTKAGDAAEVEALRAVYGQAGGQAGWCALGSVKSQIGHTKAAAGAAGLIKAALALHHKVLPPTIKVEQPIAALGNGDGPFYVNTLARPWLRTSAQAEAAPRRAAVSAFGFGGSNFHCVLEEYQGAKPGIDWTGNVQILAFSAESEPELLASIASLPTDLPWGEFRVEAARRRAQFQPAASLRLLGVVEQGRTELARLPEHLRNLMQLHAGKPTWSTPEGVYFARGRAAGKLAFVFAGQGSQYVGMGRELALRFPQAFEAMAEADRLFAAEGAGVLSRKLYPPPAFSESGREEQEASLRQTDVAQPALAAVEAADLRLLAHFGVQPAAAAGHSFGELTALHAAGCFDAATLHRLARRRGALMAAGPGDRGGMLALAMPRDAAETLVRDAGLKLVVANHNAPKQVVLSGPTAEVHRAAELAKARGLSAKVLPVSGAFHSDLVAGVAKPFGQAVAEAEFQPPAIPVFSNTTAREYPDDAAAARRLLAEQLAKPVEFVAQIEAMHRAGVRTFLEIGPGGKLAALIGSVLERSPHTALALDASSGTRADVADLARVLAQLSALGHSVDLRRWDDGISPAPAAPKKPTLTVPICGANYVKPRQPRPARPVPTPAAPAAPAVSKASVAPATPAAPPPAPAAAAPVVAPVQASAPVSSWPRSTTTTMTPQDASVVSQALHASQENLLALQKLGEQTARLHGQFLDHQARTLAAFQSMIEQQRLLQGGPPVRAAAPLMASPPPPAPSPAPLQITSTPVPAAMPRPAAPQPAVAPTPKPAAVPAPAVRVEPAPPPRTPRSNVHVAETLLAVVSEKTGYPAEMLNLAMELDTDLGIDSIKRVEIFSVLQEKMPAAPVIKPEHLGSLRTLQDVASFLGDGDAAPPHVPAASPVSTPVAGAHVAETLLAVVSEKTGYPAEMLNLAMELDTDLGIDSIKRVEIFSVLQEKMPAAPVIKPEHLGSLRTLQDVASFLAQGAAVEAPGTPEPAGQPAPAAPAVAPAPAHAELPSLKRYVLEAVEGTPRRAKLDLCPGAEFWVTEDGTGLSQNVIARLEQLGLQARRIAWADVGSLQVPAQLAGLALIAPEHTEDGTLRQAFALLQAAAPALRKAGKAGGSTFVTVSRLDGAFGLGSLSDTADILGGGLAGLAKTAAHEWPEVRCKAIDLADDFAEAEQAALALADELLVQGPLELGLASGGKRVLHLVEQPLEDIAAPALGRDDVVILTGGARGVTAECAVALAQQAGCTLALFGRSPEPSAEPDWQAPLRTESELKKALLAHSPHPLSPRELAEQFQHVLAEREITRTFDRIRQAGARVVYRQVDVRDADAVAEACELLRTHVGPIRGVLHGAGVLADRRIEDKTLEQFDAVYSTKVQGLRALLQATQADDLAFLALFSSSTGRFGRTGQVDYAVANEVLNKVAQQQARVRPDCRVLAVNWGPWDGGMVNPALKQVFENEGVSVIPLAAGATHLVAELVRPGPVEVVVLGGGAFPDLAAATAMPAIDLPLSFERDLSVETMPVLRSHVLAGRAVLPMALIAEWMAHGALHHQPGLAFHGFDDLRILKGVRLTAEQTYRVKVRAGKAVKHQAYFHVPVELHGVGPAEQDVLHARCEVVLASKLPPAPEAPRLPALPAFDADKAETYRKYLFHGPDFFGLEQVEGCSEQAIAGRASVAPPPGEWLRQPLRSAWLTDPMALDVGFQLLIVWCQENHGCGSLPAHVGKYRQFRRAFPREGVRIFAEITRNSPHRVLADLWFVDRDGAVVAQLADYECVVDASLNDAFRRNQLAADAYQSV